MFHSRQLNTKINKLHERTLRIVYQDPTLSFEQLLTLDKSVCIHHRNVQRLAIEMYKIKENLAPHLYRNFFPGLKMNIISGIKEFGRHQMSEQWDMVQKRY